MSLLNIPERIDSMKEKEIKMYPAHANRASELGHPCEFYLYALRKHYDKITPHDLGLQYIFDEGRFHEQAVLEDLRKAGFKIIEQSRAYEWKQFEIVGVIDAKIVENGTAYPVEIKNLSPYEWERLNTAEDFFTSKKVWIRKYPAQILLYSIMDSKEKAVMVLKNKLSGRYKEIDFDLNDYLDYVESILKKAERINKSLKDGTEPERIQWDESICGHCPFLKTICLVDEIRTQKIEVSEDLELEDMLKRREELYPLVKEFEEIDSELTKRVEGHPYLIVGDYIVKGQYVEMKTYNVPKEIKEKYVEKKTYWRKNIVKK